MKLRNKKTGDIVEFSAALLVKDGKNGEQPAHLEYPSLEAAMEEWENAPEEPKGKHWYMTSWGEVWQYGDSPLHEEWRRMLGNDFETKEEAEKAVEKLKAWKRLKDKGFRFTAWKNGILLNETVAGQVRYEFPIDNKDDIEKDLDLLFGGEE